MFCHRQLFLVNCKVLTCSCLVSRTSETCLFPTRNKFFVSPSSGEDAFNLCTQKFLFYFQILKDDAMLLTFVPNIYIFHFSSATLNVTNETQKKETKQQKQIKHKMKQMKRKMRQMKNTNDVKKYCSL